MSLRKGVCRILVCQVVTRVSFLAGDMFFLRLSLRKRQETKFSHTEWGTWVRARMLVSRSVTWVSFLFLPDSATVLPTLPPLSELLPRVYSGSVSTCFSGSFFAFFVDSNSVMLSIKCCCIVVWQTKNAFSVWERQFSLHCQQVLSQCFLAGKNVSVKNKCWMDCLFKP